jgi:hypothetical protein
LTLPLHHTIAREERARALFVDKRLSLSVFSRSSSEEEEEEEEVHAVAERKKKNEFRE